MPHNINNVIEQQQDQQQKGEWWWWVLGNRRQTTICNRPPTHHKVMTMRIIPHQSTWNATWRSDSSNAWRNDLGKYLVAQQNTTNNAMKQHKWALEHQQHDRIMQKNKKKILITITKKLTQKGFYMFVCCLTRLPTSSQETNLN
jgi:hypothetical protein